MTSKELISRKCTNRCSDLNYESFLSMINKIFPQDKSLRNLFCFKVGIVFTEIYFKQYSLPETRTPYMAIDSSVLEYCISSVVFAISTIDATGCKEVLLVQFTEDQNDGNDSATCPHSKHTLSALHARTINLNKLPAETKTQTLQGFKFFKKMLRCSDILYKSFFFKCCRLF